MNEGRGHSLSPCWALASCPTAIFCYAALLWIPRFLLPRIPGQGSWAHPISERTSCLPNLPMSFGVTRRFDYSSQISDCLYLQKTRVKGDILNKSKLDRTESHQKTSKIRRIRFSSAKAAKHCQARTSAKKVFPRYAWPTLCGRFQINKQSGTYWPLQNTLQMRPCSSDSARSKHAFCGDSYFS